MVKKLFWLLNIGWMLFIALSLSINVIITRENINKNTKESLNSFFKEIVATRAWNAMHGGVYVPVTDKIQPNPYLKVPDRDVYTTDDILLTKVNPAFMTRLISEVTEKEFGIKYHITSLQPIRPANEADEWEKSSLELFENGIDDVFELRTIDTSTVYRYMAPLYVKENCLKCHEEQGYKIGDIRGGISVSVGAEPYLQTLNAQYLNLSLVHLIIFIVGSLGLNFVLIKLKNQYKSLEDTNKNLSDEIEAKKKVQEDLKLSEENYKFLSTEFETIIDHIPAFIFYKDTNNRFLRVNEFMADSLGLDKEEFKSQSSNDLFPYLKSEKFFNDDKEIIASGKPIFNIEDSLDTSKGVRWFSTSKIPVPDENGKIISIIGISVDITTLRESESELTRLLEEVRDSNKRAEEQVFKVNSLNFQLMESEEKLKELNSTKDKFFSIIAHDLRNPLGASKQLMDMLVNNYDDFSEDERFDTLKDINKSSNLVYELLENLLQWSRSQRGKLEYQPINIDVSFIADSCFSLVKGSADKKNITLLNNTTKNDLVFADANMITTVIRNLVTNAIKFTPNEGTIEINTNRIEGENFMEISVKDSGVGISEDNMNKLFRLDINFTTPGTNDEKGTGLGLILCKEFIEKHGGKIWVDSKHGEGAEFKFTVPIADNI